MATEDDRKFISIIGSSHFHAIAALVDDLRRLAFGSPTEITVPGVENGLSVAVCVLSVIAFESFMVRAWHIKGRTGQARNGLDAFEKLYPEYEHSQLVVEAFVVRDLIAHNHLWELSYTWTEDDPIVLLEALRLAGGDQKYLDVVDTVSRRTRALRLHVLPTRIDRYDAARVLDAIWSALEYCDSENHSACPVKDSFIRIADRSIRFRDFVAGFRNEMLSR
jgi:hypothetical protein